ncbi:uncharacterized protein TrAtP1_004113 [Trichoderma atroviride]|uniref:uncharacterized protein n=1 Tax=Hypocrea atroviridis TaxID=63577 RepID=UPI00332D8F26|nr:hypothetical protein TrAtP1_004113 [Trichoderma atroviride]
MPCQRYPSAASSEHTAPRYWLLRSNGDGPSIVKRPQTLQVRQTPPFFRHWSLPCLLHRYLPTAPRTARASSSPTLLLHCSQHNPPGSEKASSLIGLESDQGTDDDGGDALNAVSSRATTSRTLHRRRQPFAPLGHQYLLSISSPPLSQPQRQASANTSTADFTASRTPPRFDPTGTDSRSEGNEQHQVQTNE